MTATTILQGASGHLSCGSNSTELEFSVLRRRSGDIVIACEPLAFDANRWLRDLFHTPQMLVPNLLLSAKAGEGIRIESRVVHMRSCGLHEKDGRTVLVPDLRAAHVAIQYKNQTAPSPFTVRYWVPGLRAWRAEVQTQAFDCLVEGNPSAESPDEMLGYIAFKLRDPSEVTEALVAQCDSHVERLAQFLSLSDGHWITWNIREVIAEDERISTFYRGRVKLGTLGFPLFHFLNLKPVLEFALGHYTSELCDSTGLAVAIEWSLMNPAYSEAQLLCGCTALEHLVDVHREGIGLATLVPRPDFNALRRALMLVLEKEMSKIETDPALTADLMAAFGARISQLNQKSLRASILALCAHYAVPLTGIEADLLDLINLRNIVVHRGGSSISQFPHGLSYYCVILRELLVRIFMSILKYEGNYTSYLNGPGSYRYPSLEKV